MRFAVFVFVFLFMIMSIRTVARAYEWADIEKFYNNELKYNKDAVRIYNNLAIYYSDHKLQ